MIVSCVRWDCRFSLILRDLDELMAERGVAVDHTTIWRWVQRNGLEYAGSCGEQEAKILHVAYG